MTTAWFDGHGLILPAKRGSIEERNRARLTAARAAVNADELRHFLDVLALWPAQDTAQTKSEPPTVWGSDYTVRRRARVTGD